VTSPSKTWNRRERFKVRGTFIVPSVFPAKAGIYRESALASRLLIPAFAEKTEVLDINLIFPTQFESHPESSKKMLYPEIVDKVQGFLSILHFFAIEVPGCATVAAQTMPKRLA